MKLWTVHCRCSGAGATRAPTLPDLTAAMGINRPSLYAAFGSKEELFRKALDRYVEGPAAFVREALNEPTARAVAERLLGGTIDLVTDRRNPRGCLIVQGALACGETAESVRREVAARRVAGEVALFASASSALERTAICRTRRTPLISLAMW